MYQNFPSATQVVPIQSQPSERRKVSVPTMQQNQQHNLTQLGQTITDFGRTVMNGTVTSGIGAIYDNHPNQSMLLNNSIIQSKLIPKNAPQGIPQQDNRKILGSDNSNLQNSNQKQPSSTAVNSETKGSNDPKKPVTSGSAQNNKSAIVTEDQRDQIQQSPNVKTTNVPSGPADQNKFQFAGAAMLSRMNDISLKDKIMIHVIDDNKSQKRDFQFSRSLLVRYMKYFDKCLKKISENDEIDISIHCDAGIFEWLLCYILAYDDGLNQKQLNTQNQTSSNQQVPQQKSWQLKIQKCDNEVIDNKLSTPTLDLKNVVSILISADFLKIDLLVNECVSFFVGNIEEMAKLQVDMSCINSTIIREIARQVDLDRLDLLKERKDKLVSRLFMKKLEVLLEKDKNYLHRCGYCLQLFTRGQRKLLSCPKGRAFVDAQGRLRAEHAIDKEWDLKKFITFVRETYRISWKEIYWKVWAFLHVFSCQQCSHPFQLQQLAHCAFHPKQPRAKNVPKAPASTLFEYECCSQSQDIYKMMEVTAEHLKPTGCKMQLHQPNEAYGQSIDKQRKTLQRVITHQLIILENQPPQMIEDIKVSELAGTNSNSGHDQGKQIQVQITLAQSSSCPSSIVKPSSLNYKISLRQAVEEFVKKESKIDDYQIMVEECSISEENANNQVDNKNYNFNDELDDALYQMNVQVIARLKPNPGNNDNKQEWEKEEEKIKKRLEKNAINTLKYKYASQTNTNNIPQQQDISQQPPVNQQQLLKPQPATDQNGQPLSADQIEEAKALTANKLKQYKKDRLFQNDFERVGQLAELLKRVRVNDVQLFQKQQEAQPQVQTGASFGQNANSPRPGDSPAKPKGGLNTSLLIPGSQNTNTGIQTGQKDVQLNQQQPQNVMTQISSIVNKRSRSTNYQGTVSNNNQTTVPINNINVNNKNNDASESYNVLGANPSQDRSQKFNGTGQLNVLGVGGGGMGGGSVNPPRKNSNNLNPMETAMNSTKSPRINRGKNVSPPSRDKSFQYQQVSGMGVPQLGPIGLIAPSAIMQQHQQQLPQFGGGLPLQNDFFSAGSATIGSGGFLGNNTSGTLGGISSSAVNGQSPLKVGGGMIMSSGTTAVANAYQNAISANATFYNNHRKTYSNKLPSIQGQATGNQGNSMNNKTVDSSLSNTYYSKE